MWTKTADWIGGRLVLTAAVFLFLQGTIQELKLTNEPSLASVQCEDILPVNMRTLFMFFLPSAGTAWLPHRRVTWLVWTERFAVGEEKRRMIIQLACRGVVFLSARSRPVQFFIIFLSSTFFRLPATWRYANDHSGKEKGDWIPGVCCCFFFASITIWNGPGSPAASLGRNLMKEVYSEGPCQQPSTLLSIWISLLSCCCCWWVRRGQTGHIKSVWPMSVLGGKTQKPSFARRTSRRKFFFFFHLNDYH